MDEQTKETTAKERRAEARAKKKAEAEERAKLVETIAAKPTDQRISVFNNKYPTSSEEDWEYYPDAGWVFIIGERMSFFSSYKQCLVDKKWYINRQVVACRGSMWIARANIEASGYAKCAFTEAYVPKDSLVPAWVGTNIEAMVSIDARERLFRQCDMSGVYVHHGDLMSVMGHPSILVVHKSFMDGKNFNQCGDCGAAGVVTNFKSRPPHGLITCFTCHNKRISANLIHSHDYSKYPPAQSNELTNKIMVGGEEFKDGPWLCYAGKRKMTTMKYCENRWFGVEAETEISRKTAEHLGTDRYKLALSITETLGRDFVIIKEDGTLTANGHYGKHSGYSGFEIVSCPASLQVHRAKWPLIAKAEGYSALRAWDEYDTCGFHIHVSRDALTDMQIGRMLMFINHKNNAKFIFRVAGRGSDRFCKYLPKHPEDKNHPVTDIWHVRDRVMSAGEDNDRNRSRRVALNLSNEKTVELRIFRGTVQPRHIIRNIEFLDAVCDYCHPASRGFSDLADYTIFIGFVSANRKKWPLLAEWMANQKIIALKIAGEKAEKDKLTLKPHESVEVTVKERPEPEPPPKTTENTLVFKPGQKFDGGLLLTKLSASATYRTLTDPHQWGDVAPPIDPMEFMPKEYFGVPSASAQVAAQQNPVLLKKTNPMIYSELKQAVIDASTF